MAVAAGLLRRLLERVAGPAGEGRLDRTRAARPLQATRFVALDLETTGLDVRRDAIVQVAMIGLAGLTVAPEPLLEAMVNPQRPIPVAATRIHGIRDADVRDAASIDRLLPQIVDRWSDAVVIGHHVGFDLAMLGAAARRTGHALLLPPFLDTWALAARLDPRTIHLDLAETARRFGIDAGAFRRHDAAGDARLAAHLFVHLAERLIATGRATLGQAAAAAERRSFLR